MIRFFIFLIFSFLILVRVWATEEVYQPKKMNCEDNRSYPVHLTFDDGPQLPETQQILDTLKKNNVKATFLVTMEHFPSLAAGKQPSEDELKLLKLIERMKIEGHTVGSHSYEHIPHSESAEKPKIQENLEKSYKVISKFNLTKPIPFRFPFGSGWFDVEDPQDKIWSESVQNQVIAKGYFLFHWDIDSWDWSAIKRKALPESVLKQICSHNGGIVLNHDIQPFTAANLQSLIDSVQMSGHQLVSHQQIINYSKTTANLASLQKWVQGIFFCEKPIGNFDQIWKTCDEYGKKSSDPETGHGAPPHEGSVDNDLNAAGVH